MFIGGFLLRNLILKLIQEKRTTLIISSRIQSKEGIKYFIPHTGVAVYNTHNVNNLVKTDS